MSVPKPPLTLGVEEEYQIIEPETRNLHSYISEFLSQDEVRPTRLNVKPELMQSQVEVGSHVCRNIREVRQEIIRLRRSVVDMAEGKRTADCGRLHPPVRQLGRTVDHRRCSLPRTARRHAACCPRSVDLWHARSRWLWQRS